MFPCCLSAIQTCIQQLSLGLSSPHREARLRRRELRQRQHAEVEELEGRMKQLQAANESKQRQLEEMRKVPCSGPLRELCELACAQDVPLSRSFAFTRPPTLMVQWCVNSKQANQICKRAFICVHIYICRGKAVSQLLTSPFSMSGAFLLLTQHFMHLSNHANFLVCLIICCGLTQRSNSFTPPVLDRKWRRQLWRITGGRGVRRTCKTSTNWTWRERKW